MRGAFLALALLAAGGARAELSPQEKQIARYVETHNDKAIQLLQRVVDIESPTENHAGVKRVADVFREEFRKIGMSARWVDMRKQVGRAGHLIAETKGTTGQRMLLIGHLDTVLRGEKFRRVGDQAFGTGTSDMKSGLVVALQALKALHAAGALADARITVMFTGDEELPGRPHEVARAAMVEAARASDLVLSFEPMIDNKATIGRRGSSTWALEVEAQTGHSSQIFKDKMGAGAAYELGRILEAFYDALRDETYLTVSPALVLAGTTAAIEGASGKATGKHNVVAARATATGDLRFISEKQKESARERMRKIVARSLPGTTARISFEDGYPAVTPMDGNRALLREFDRASVDLGYGEVPALDPGERGAGDTGFVAHLLPMLDGIGGGMGENAHAPGEWSRLDNFEPVTKRAALLIHRLSRRVEPVQDPP